MPYEKSPAQRAIDWGKIIETALDMPGNVGNVYNRFYNYSYANQTLLWMQGAREPVATYKRWQALGRQVMKGAKAYEIIHPIFAKKTEDDEESVIIGFKAARRIFTYSQTEGEDLPPVEPPEWDIDTALQQFGIAKIPFRRNDANIQGYSYDRNIAINPFAVHPEKTLFHEVGHVVLGHTMPEVIAEYEQHRSIFEFQAEASAHLAMNELGQLTDEMATHSRGYIQEWLSLVEAGELAGVSPKVLSYRARIGEFATCKRDESRRCTFVHRDELNRFLPTLKLHPRHLRDDIQPRAEISYSPIFTGVQSSLMKTSVPMNAFMAG